MIDQREEQKNKIIWNITRKIRIDQGKDWRRYYMEDYKEDKDRLDGGLEKRLYGRPQGRLGYNRVRNRGKNTWKTTRKIRIDKREEQ